MVPKLKKTMDYRFAVVALTVCGETRPGYAVEEEVKGCDTESLPRVKRLEVKYGKKQSSLEWQRPRQRFEKY